MPEHDVPRRSRTAARTTPRTGLRRQKAGLEPRLRKRAAFDLNADERHERFTLIEFVWDIASGVQPVILAERRLLH